MLNFLYSVSSWCYVSHSHSFPNLEAKMVMIDLLITVSLHEPGHLQESVQ